MDYGYDPIPLAPRPRLENDAALERARSYYDLMMARRSVRHFDAEPVPREVIEFCIKTAGTAPSGANHQPWHFVCVDNPAIKREIRLAAEKEEREFYAGKAGDEWLRDLSKIGTDAQKPFLETAPWLIAIFAERYGIDEDGNRRKHYYTPESVGIATGMLISALHNAGLATLTHTPSPMGFLKEILERPKNERAYMLIVVGHAARDAKVPRAATVKKPFNKLASFLSADSEV